MILQEMKKIFGIKRILLIVIFAVLYYFLFFQLNVGIPAYSSERVLLEVSLELVEKYGENIDETEYKDILENFGETEESKIDTWIKTHDDYKQYGIESYGDLLEIRDSLPDADAAYLTSQVSEKFTPDEIQEAMKLAFKKGYLNRLIDSYHTELTQITAYYFELSEQVEKRIAERNEEEVYSFMSYGVMRNYLRILPDFTIFLFLSMIFLIVPYSVKDTMEGIPVLQYTSKKGCKFYWKKLAAVLISSIILCVIEIGWFILMLNQNKTFSFTGCFVSGFWNPFITFMKLTFGQYIVMSIAYIVVIAICLSMITYGLSSCAHNYISAIALQIPAIIFSFVLSFGLMYNFAEITQNIMLLFLVPCICFLIAVIGNVIRYVSIRHYEQF